MILYSIRSTNLDFVSLSRAKARLKVEALLRRPRRCNRDGLCISTIAIQLTTAGRQSVLQRGSKVQRLPDTAIPLTNNHGSGKLPSREGWLNDTFPLNNLSFAEFLSIPIVDRQCQRKLFQTCHRKSCWNSGRSDVEERIWFRRVEEDHELVSPVPHPDWLWS